MANEAVVVELYGYNGDGRQRNFTVADATTIKKGSLMVFTDPRTAASAAATSSAAIISCAGIASMDKVANDGSVQISVWTDGIFDCVASAAILKGEAITFVGNNCVAPTHVGAASGATIGGYALEAGTANEVINVRINL